MFKKNLLVLAIGLTLLPAAWAADSSVTALTSTPPPVAPPTAAQALVSLLTRYQSLMANFIQAQYDANGTFVQSSSGAMAILRPGNFIWHTKQPNEQLIMTNGKTLWIYDIDLQQVTVSKLQPNKNTTAGMLMTTSAKDLQANYTVTQVNAPSRESTYQLVPKQKNSDFQWVSLTFKEKVLLRMQIKDNTGQLTSISFKNLKTNPNLSTAQFNLEIPKNVDVINE